MSLRELTFNKEILSEFWVRSETVQSSNTDPAYSDSNTIVCLCQVLHNQTPGETHLIAEEVSWW